MAITDILAKTQGGQFFVNAGKTAGLTASVSRAAIDQLAPAIAVALKEKAQQDPEAFEDLLELLEDGGDLDDQAATTGAEALEDGAAILADIYGSDEEAQKNLARVAPDVPAASLARIGAISAVSVLTTLAASNSAQLTADDPVTAASTSASGGGFFSVLIAAILKGLMQGAARQLAPKRRRRSYTSRYGNRRTTTRKRRRSTPSLDTIFRDILTKR